MKPLLLACIIFLACPAMAQLDSVGFQRFIKAKKAKIDSAESRFRTNRDIQPKPDSNEAAKIERLLLAAFAAQYQEEIEIDTTLVFGEAKNAADSGRIIIKKFSGDEGVFFITVQSNTNQGHLIQEVFAPGNNVLKYSSRMYWKNTDKEVLLQDCSYYFIDDRPVYYRDGVGNAPFGAMFGYPILKTAYEFLDPGLKFKK